MRPSRSPHKRGRHSEKVSNSWNRGEHLEGEARKPLPGEIRWCFLERGGRPSRHNSRRKREYALAACGVKSMTRGSDAEHVPL